MTDGLRSRVAAALAALAVFGLVSSPSVALAECRQWDVRGQWVLAQDNDFIVELTFEQSGNRLAGIAAAHRTGDVTPSPVNLVGRVEGNTVQFTVDWGWDDSVGFYEGTISEVGQLRGRTYDSGNPDDEGSAAKWRGDSMATCLDQAEAEPARPVLDLGKVKGPAGTTPPDICSAAKAARKRGSPAAPGLEAQCQAAEAAQTPVGDIQVALNVSAEEIADFAAKGRALIKQDRLAAELRKRQGQGAGQLGFEVGIGVTDNDTAEGPGKDRVGLALGPDEFQGFEVAMAYALERNRNLKRARIGAAIAREDDEVQEARTADRDVFYWLGFDIATAIFGDPDLGAQGNTATGPGSLGIRDGLVSAAARQGFNDAVTFHLARRY